MRLSKTLRACISVYEGISPALLATMSLGQNIKGATHSELISNLKQSNIVQCPHVYQALLQLDRQSFTACPSPYENKPYGISSHQKMTDMLTHAVILETLSPHLNREQLRVLDIGTGHGYVAFAVEAILDAQGLKDHKVVGIDIHEQNISFCRGLRSSKVEFICRDLVRHLSDKLVYDVIIGGFYCSEELSDKLQEVLSEQGVGVWASQSESGQALYKWTKASKVYVMETLFSMPLLNPQVQKYFLQQGEQGEDVFKEEAFKEETPRQVKRQEKKERLRALLQAYKLKHGRAPKLSQMQQDAEMSAALGRLKGK